LVDSFESVKMHGPTNPKISTVTVWTTINEETIKETQYSGAKHEDV